jgi:hypothetical protein
MADDSKDLLRMPTWAPVLFMALGALGTMALDIDPGKVGSALASMAFLSGTMWYTWYRSQLIKQQRNRSQVGPG